MAATDDEEKVRNRMRRIGGVAKCSTRRPFRLKKGSHINHVEK
jgi:hypothetical protein